MSTTFFEASACNVADAICSAASANASGVLLACDYRYPREEGMLPKDCGPPEHALPEPSCGELLPAVFVSANTSALIAAAVSPGGDAPPAAWVAEGGAAYNATLTREESSCEPYRKVPAV
ncbi:hypothetical protein EMIHUDRAFT_458919 [Emiliania huxleyi CCMP1516]|uniref:Uncharacterized protein n=2 Tax=Emiliania huxleyi TaxID=2903 RepID=A0A0D3J4X1_EMIH1|nr:hypothetical protein EMIHUDRAFT_458919 [Emiliania huxleyi CCMP1516]EOD18556.1 hypothetical protein EMIHUDRAFT_458919 [Emiliania huxleyi CCMP1516]|eukprot:XP_005770985.1 hypothetical protein EMIHUDRAFT_458919 [Emiliania huxleyi CCMP1516]